MPRLVVKCTWGAERPETLLQAFTVAATAAASGVDVSLWLTGDAVFQAMPGVADVELPHSPPLSHLREAVLAAGTVTVCTQCVQRRDIGARDLLEGVRIAGSAAFVSESLDPDTTALVY
ncbi:DsrE family protein [Demequina sp.]|uniref:DsrE family protein n=1 Tax=Demequina sp. TaxID=2050685 RepID=UPI0025BE30C4|nr:DsrE family protein [Demequina sp.]